MVDPNWKLVVAYELSRNPSGLWKVLLFTQNDVQGLPPNRQVMDNVRVDEMQLIHRLLSTNSNCYVRDRTLSTDAVVAGTLADFDPGIEGSIHT